MSDAAARALLSAQFNPAAAGELDVHVTLQWGEQAVAFSISESQLQFDTLADEPGLIIYFPDENRMRQLLTGQLNPVEAFMSGALRSNGYIMWVFAVLAAFPPAA